MVMLAGVIVGASAAYLIGLAFAAVLAADRTKRFLNSFARSARAHVLEQSLRLIAGVGLIVYAGEMRFSLAFEVFGGVLAATACILLMLPWTWHRRFGEWAIPLATRNLNLLALGSFALGALLIYGML